MSGHAVGLWGVLLLIFWAGFSSAQTPQDPQIDEADIRKHYKQTAQALVIGNAHYQVNPPWRPLGSPSADAEAVRELLGPYVTIDPHSGSDLTLTGMDTALKEFAQSLIQRKPRVAIIYFSGHGITIDGQGMLLPVDAPGTFNSNFLRKVWTVDKLLEAMAQTGVPASIIVLDACREPFGTASLALMRQRPVQLASLMLAQADPPSPAVGLPEFTAQAARGILIAYATAAGKTAADGSPGQHSIYTTELLAVLGQELPVQQIIAKASDAVVSKTQQRPWFSQVALDAGIYLNPPLSARSREYRIWVDAQRDPQAYLNLFLNFPAFRHSVYRPAAEALYRQLVARKELLPESPLVDAAMPAVVTLALQQRLPVMETGTNRVVARIPAGETATFDLGSLFEDRVRVLSGQQFIGTAARSMLPAGVVSTTLGFDLQFHRDSAQLEIRNSGDYLQFVESLRGKRVRSMLIVTSGDEPGDAPMAVIRAEAVKRSIQNLNPNLAPALSLQPNLDMAGSAAQTSRLIVRLDTQ